MKFFLFFFCIVFLSSCNKTKTVFICGDHECVNKLEAQKFFEENLSLEVRVLTSKNQEIIDLVELNLKENRIGKKEISVTQKKKTKKDIKKLSKLEIKKRKAELKIKNKKIKTVKEKEKSLIMKKVEKKDSISKKNISKKDNNVNVVDICTIIEKCNIDEISKYLIKQGKSKKFPDITIRE